MSHVVIPNMVYIIIKIFSGWALNELFGGTQITKNKNKLRINMVGI